MSTTGTGTEVPPPVHTAVVVHAEESTCDVWFGSGREVARYAPQFPSPRAGRVSPGHLVAVGRAPDGANVVLWRWYDAVVVGHDAKGVHLWEPAHGEFVAEARPSYERLSPGSRAYASAGLPGAEWWVTGAVATSPEIAVIDVDAVVALYTDNNLWPTALGI